MYGVRGFKFIVERGISLGILDGIVEWIAEQVMNILDMINTSVLGALGCDMETFLRYFPAAETFYSIIVALAVGLLMLNLIFQLLRNFGIMHSGEAESPVSLTSRTILFLFLALIALILLVMLAWNYLKLLFEAAERYVLLGVLVYTAPMAFSMGGSMNTINIFRSWCRMLGGQIFMILMNVWCLRIFTSMFANFISNPLSLENGNFLIWFLCAIGFLKISQKIDNFMQMLGINVGRTGSSMLGEAAIAMRGLGMTGKTIGGGGSSSGSSSYNSSSSETVMQSGLAGVVGRQFNQNAISNITGKSDSIASNIARSVYNSSIQNGGGFSTNVISTVAKGDIARTGSIKGDDAVQGYNYGNGYISWAIENYGGYTEANAQEFSRMMQKKLGWSGYGNPKYVSDVFKYLVFSGNGIWGSPFIGKNWNSAVSSEFGWRTDPLNGSKAFHEGLDIAYPTGTQINAVSGGVVTSVVFSKNGYGHHIRVDCGNGVTVLYAHCSDIFVTKGQSVAAGQVIAEVGATGRVTGAHLHLGVLVNGEEVNPREYISQ